MRWIMIAALLGITGGSFYLVGCSENASANVGITADPSLFTVVAKGAGAANGVYGDKTIQSMDSEEEFNNALYRYGVKASKPVDFNTHNVVLLDMGLHMNSGYAINVTSVERGDGFIKLNISNRVPGKNCVSTALLSSPFVMVAIPKDNEVIYSESIDQIACS